MSSGHRAYRGNPQSFWDFLGVLGDLGGELLSRKDAKAQRETMQGIPAKPDTALGTAENAECAK